MSAPVPPRGDSHVAVAAIIATAAVFIALLIFAPSLAWLAFVLLLFALS